MSNLDQLVAFLRALKALLEDNEATGLGLSAVNISYNAEPIDSPALPSVLLVPLEIDLDGSLGGTKVLAMVFDWDAHPDASLDALGLAGRVWQQIRRHKNRLPGALSAPAGFHPGRLKLDDTPDEQQPASAMLYVPLVFTVNFRSSQ